VTLALFPSRTLVLIPALNEEACVASTIHGWRELGFDRVRVVDNGSTDDTASAAARSGVEVVREPRRGYGAACWTGLREMPPDREWILFSSADGSDQLTPTDLTRWQRAIDAGAQFILGDRFSDAEARRHLKWVQRLGNRFCCGLIFLGWGARFRDMGSLRLIRRDAFDRLHLQDRGFGWNVEMQVRAVEEGMPWVELPVAYHPRRAGTSKISGSVRGTVRAAWGMAGMIARLWAKRVGPRP